MSDGVGAAVVTRRRQFVAELQDSPLELRDRGVGTRSWSSRARLERRGTAVPVPRDQFGHPRFGDAGTARRLPVTHPTAKDSLHHVALHAHTTPPKLVVGTMS